MSEPQFLKSGLSLTLGEIATLTGATLVRGDASKPIRDVAPLDLAGPGDISFIDSAKFVDQLTRTRAGACFGSDKFFASVPQHVALLTSRAPYRALVAVARALFPGALKPSSLHAADEGVSPAAFVHATAHVEGGVTIDPGAVIGANAEIGAGSVIGPGAVIGPDVRIGRDCAVGPGASVTNALVGDRVILHAGCRIGQDGFGFLPTPEGHQKVPQVGRVIIQDGVEVGANTTIDRGAMRDTVIGEGSKIDNLVQIGHNVSIGRHCIIVSQTGIAGSSTVGDYVMMGGQAAMIDHITVGEGAMIAAGGRVMESVPAGAKWAGWPAGPAREWMREVVAIKRLTKRGPAGSEEAGKRSDG